MARQWKYLLAAGGYNGIIKSLNLEEVYLEQEETRNDNIKNL